MVTFKELQNVIRPSSLYPSLSFSIPHNQSILKSHMLIWQTLTLPDFSTSVPFGIIFPLPRIPFPPLLHVKICQNLKLYFFFSTKLSLMPLPEIDLSLLCVSVAFYSHFIGVLTSCLVLELCCIFFSSGWNCLNTGPDLIFSNTPSC